MAVYEIGNAAAPLILQGGGVGVGGGGGEGGLSIGTCSEGVQVVITAELWADMYEEKEMEARSVFVFDVGAENCSIMRRGARIWDGKRGVGDRI